MDTHTIEVSGTFAGHLYFGLLFTGWAVAWLVDGFARTSGPDDGPLERGSLLPSLKLVLPLIACWFELPNSGWDPDDAMMGWAHIASYFPFALTGCVDLLAQRGRLPPRAGYPAFAAAMLNAAFLFWAHDDHGGVPGASHSLLVLLLASSAGLALLEWTRGGAWLGWVRRGSVLALGTWLLLLTWILYHSGWVMADPIRVGWTYVLFSWNAIAVATLVTSAWLVVDRKSRSGT